MCLLQRFRSPKTPTGETLIHSEIPNENTGKFSSNRIMKVHFKTKERHLSFLHFYAPTEQATPEKKKFYICSLTKLKEILKIGDIKILNLKISSNDGVARR